jgi:hypothetical protein
MSEKLILAVVFLLFGFLVAVFLSFRFRREDYKAFGDGKGFIGLLTLLFLASLLSLYAFLEKEWTADLLKILLGVLVGGGSAAAANSFSQRIQGDNNFQAVNAQIDSLKSEVSKIENANAGKIEQLFNVTQHGFANFANDEGTIVPIARAKLRFTLDEDPGLDRYVRDGDVRTITDLLPKNTLFDNFSELERFAFAFFEIKEFRVKMRDFLEGLKRDGFVVTANEGWDNVQGGIEFYFRIGKDLQETD